MRDILLEVRTLLYDSPELLSILGGKRVYKVTVPTSRGSQYPRVVLSEITGDDTDYMDNEPTSIEYIVQVSIFDKKETLAIYQVIDPILKENGWRRLPGSPEIYEEDTQLYHRPLRYRKKH